jgi:enoyl-CoA hydratase
MRDASAGSRVAASILIEEDMEFKNLLIEAADGIATLTINRPESLNSLNTGVLDELKHAMCRLETDVDVRVVVLTGAGDKAFAAGADIREMAGMTNMEGHAFAVKGQSVMLAVRRMKKPVIAAVNGYALGGGLELAMACDFIYASEKAKFGLPEVTLGIMPGFGGTWSLVRLVGPNKASELIFSGKIIDANKACEWGIVNEVFPAGDLLPKARETAAAIAAACPLGVGYARDAISSGADMAREDGFRYEASLFGLLFATEDRKEGMAAFLGKRKADFKGK